MVRVIGKWEYYCLTIQILLINIRSLMMLKTHWKAGPVYSVWILAFMVDYSSSCGCQYPASTLETLFNKKHNIAWDNGSHSLAIKKQSATNASNTKHRFCGKWRQPRWWLVSQNTLTCQMSWNLRHLNKPLSTKISQNPNRIGICKYRYPWI